MNLHETTVVLVAAKTATLAFGSALTYLSYSAFRRTDSRALRALTIGIALLTLGVLLGGVLHQFADITLEASVSVQSVFTAVGFAVMTYSLFVDIIDEPDRTRSGARTGD
ncbi:DUF7521 family protein [Salinibaculum salinum]|uniref:DUF7521 family protein n=1 Tax=Salinibaculum salinum TaxID=3131996 RepID=UPI0030EF694E